MLNFFLLYDKISMYVLKSLQHNAHYVVSLPRRMAKGQLESDKKCNLRQKTYDLRQKYHFCEFFYYKVAGSIYTKEAVSLTEKKYTSDGFLYVSELDRCPLFEKESAVRSCRSEDCFYCKFSDFRKREYIERVETEVRRGVLYSVCHNVKNKKRVL